MSEDIFWYLVYWVGVDGQSNLYDKFSSLHWSLPGLQERFDTRHAETRADHFSHFEIYRQGDGKDAPPVYRTGGKANV
jgi:hypothetical protein